jgi:hypothetical protein
MLARFAALAKQAEEEKRMEEEKLIQDEEERRLKEEKEKNAGDWVTKAKQPESTSKKHVVEVNETVVKIGECVNSLTFEFE